MTQNTTVEPQPMSAAELWTAYQVQQRREKELRQRWYVFSDRFQQAAARVSSAYARSRKAYDAYQAAHERCTELHRQAQQAEQAECNENTNIAGSVPLAA